MRSQDARPARARPFPIAAPAAAGITAAATLLVLLPTVSAPWLWDDHVHLFLARRLPLSWSASHGLLGVYFRPLGEAVLWLVVRLAGTAPAGPHLIGAALIAAVTGGVALLVGRETADGTAGLAAGLLLAACPVTVTSGAWFSNLYGVLSAGLGLAALLAVRRPALAVLLALFAAAAKEDGVLWLPAVLVLAAGTVRPVRRLIPATVLGGAGLAGMLAWRTAVLGGTGGMVQPHRLLAAVPGGAPAIAMVLLVLTVGTALLPSALARAALAAGVPGGLLGVALLATVPHDPHGLWMRLLLLPAAASAIVWGRALAGSPARVRRALLLVTAALIAAGSVASLRWERRWRVATDRSDRLVRATVRSLRERPDLSGPVRVEGDGGEIALAAAVGRVAPDRLATTVPLQTRGVNLLVCPQDLWPDVRRRLDLVGIPGNPGRYGRWVVGLGFVDRSAGSTLPSIRPFEEAP